MTTDISRVVEEAAKRNEREIRWQPEEFFFDKQLAVFQSASRYRAVVCGRRGGKSYTWAASLIHEGFKYPRSTPLFVCTSRQDARDILEPAMDHLNEMFGLGMWQNKATGDYYLPNGTRIILRGAGTMREINKLRGRKYPCAIIDEGQNFGPDLNYLIDEAIEPATADYHGWIGISGTPGPVRLGPFYDIAEGENKDAWEHFHWTFFDNPHIPDKEGFIKNVMERRRWDESHPSFQREYLGKWIQDDNARAFQMQPHRDIISTFDPAIANDWDYVMGIDVGYNDPFAFVVIAQSQMLGQAFVVDTHEEGEMTTMEALVRAERLCAEYPITRIALDTGGAGKLVAADWRKMSTLPISAAKKTHKASQVSVINGDFQAGKIKITRDKNLKLISDMMILEWDSDKKDKGKYEYRRGSSDHLADAFQYGYNLCFHHTFDPKEDLRVKAGSKDWYQRKEEAMERAQIKQVNERSKDQGDIFDLISP